MITLSGDQKSGALIGLFTFLGVWFDVFPMFLGIGPDTFFGGIGMLSLSSFLSAVLASSLVLTLIDGNKFNSRFVFSVGLYAFVGGLFFGWAGTLAGFPGTFAALGSGTLALYASLKTPDSPAPISE